MTSSKKHVAFICAGYPSPGGVETVTGLLAGFLVENGYQVSILVSEKTLAGTNTTHPHYSLLHGMPGITNSTQNLRFIHDFIVGKQVSCVFNQGCFSLIYRQKHLLPDTQIINTLHCNPFWEIQKFVNSRLGTLLAGKHGFTEKTKIVARKCLGIASPVLTHPGIRGFYREQIEKSDWYIVLDETFKSELEQKLYNGENRSSILVIPNPVPTPTESNAPKEHCVLFVGRLNAAQKRVDRLLRIWKIIQEQAPDWILEIVGDGEDQSRLKQLAAELQLQRVRFEGFQAPESYYQKASILCLTSTYEGAPMVIPEAQSYGTIPMVFGSVSSFYSLIDDGMNGVILPPFEEDLFAEELLRLMNDEIRRQNMAVNTRLKAEKYSIGVIGEKWLKLLEKE